MDSGGGGSTGPGDAASGGSRGATAPPPPGAGPPPGMAAAAARRRPTTRFRSSRAYVAAPCAAVTAATPPTRTMPIWSAVMFGANGRVEGRRAWAGPIESQKSGIVQPMQPWPAFTFQLVAEAYWTLAPLAKTSGPLQPILYRHQPFWAPSSPQARTHSPNS